MPVCPSVCPSVCLSVHTNSASSGRILMKSDTWWFFENLFRTRKFNEDLCINGPFTWRTLRVYVIWLNTSVYVPPVHICTNLFPIDGNMWGKRKVSIPIRRFLLCMLSDCLCRISFLLHLSTSLLSDTPLSEGTVVYLIDSFLGNGMYKCFFYVLLTVRLRINLVNDQLDLQFLFYNTFITVLYMFRTTSCSSSGSQIVLIQHLV